MKHITRIALRLAGASLFALVASACSTISFHSQELVLDRNPETDSATVELTYRDFSAVNKHSMKLWGEQPAPEPDFEGAMGFLNAIASGQEAFMLLVPLAVIELGDAIEKDELTEAEFSFLRGIHVVNASVFEGPKGEIMAFQRLQIPELSVGIDLLNEAIRKAAFEIEESHEPFRGYTPIEIYNLKIFLADANAGFDWVQWNEGGLRVAIPVTPTYLLNVINEGLDEMIDEDDFEELPNLLEFVRGFSDSVRDFRIEKDHVVLHIGNAEGDFTLDTKVSLDYGLIPELRDFREELRAHIRETGIQLPMTWEAGE